MARKDLIDQELSVVDEFSVLYNVYTLEKLRQAYEVQEIQGGGIMILIHKQNKKVGLKHRTYLDRGSHRYELKVWVENWTVGIRNEELEVLLLSPEKPDEELEKLNNSLLKKRLDDMKKRGFRRFLPERDKKGRVILRAVLEKPYSDLERNREAFYDSMVRPALIYALREEEPT